MRCGGLRACLVNARIMGRVRRALRRRAVVACAPYVSVVARGALHMRRPIYDASRVRGVYSVPCGDGARCASLARVVSSVSDRMLVAL